MMPIVTLDFETYFDKDYTLNKLTTEAYVRDPRFRVHGVAIRWPDGETCWLDQPSYNTLHELHDGDFAILCHHAHFDGLILSHHFGVRPRMWLDTMAMGRLLLGNHISVSLESLARQFGLAPKSVPYDRMKGKTWEQMDEGLRRDVGEGAVHDVQLTWDIFCRMAAGFPAEEYSLVDACVRMFTEPMLVGNTPILTGILQAEQNRKSELLGALGVTADELRSKSRFASLLRECGIEIGSVEEAHDAFAGIGPAPPGWKSTAAGMDYAFAKPDQFMLDLLDDADERVAALAEARLVHASSIVTTRAERLRAMSTRGAMCVYLSPYAAHTTRFGGGDRVNWQNFPRNSDLGKGIEAPAGHMIITVDASQIECRILNMLAHQDDVIEKFRRGEDVYVENATRFYRETVYKPSEGDPRYNEMLAKRGFGKQLELSCGFGAGGPSIVATAKRGTYGPPIYLTEEEGLIARDLYRTSHWHVVGLWDDAEYKLGLISRGDPFEWVGGIIHRNKRLYLPNGAPLIYETLAWNPGEHKRDWRRGWQFQTRNGPQKLYGAKLIENIVQALARLHTTQAWLRCQQVGIRMVSMEHDKLIAVVPEVDAEAALKLMVEEMTKAPTWLPGIPLDSEGSISRTLKK